MLPGYDSGFTTIGALDATLLSDTDLVLTLQVADLGLLLDELSIGFAAGWCGPEDYYCDHYPGRLGLPLRVLLFGGLVRPLVVGS
ncbi:MAG: hypothetical protein IPK67_19540 [Planctomycetes bacterium]|nr:hypothetical protein [Planctomycetota bacterium]